MAAGLGLLENRPLTDSPDKKDIVGNRKILSPGIGAQGGDPDLVTGLVDGIIVGRAIYEADTPGAVAQAYSRICMK